MGSFRGRESSNVLSYSTTIANPGNIISPSSSYAFGPEEHYCAAPPRFHCVFRCAYRCGDCPSGY